MLAGRETAAKTALPPLAARRRGARWGLVALGLLLAAGLPSARARGAEDDAAAATFQAIVKGWSAQSASAVLSTIPEKGVLRLSLLAPGTAGTYRRAQAERVLTEYFKKVSDIRLKNVTPRDAKDPPGYRVRSYEYRYQPQGQDPQKSVLTITLREVERSWHLVAVEERPSRAVGR